MNYVELDIPDEDEDAIIDKRRKEREELLKVCLVWMKMHLKTVFITIISTETQSE